MTPPSRTPEKGEDSDGNPVLRFPLGATLTVPYRLIEHTDVPNHAESYVCRGTPYIETRDGIVVDMSSQLVAEIAAEEWTRAMDFIREMGT